MTTRTRFMVLGFMAGTVLIAIGVCAVVMDHRRVRQDAMATPETLIPHPYLTPPVVMPYIPPELPVDASPLTQEAVDRAIDAKIAAAFSYDGLAHQPFFPWVAGGLMVTFLLALVGALHRGAPKSEPALLPYEIESLGMQIEDWAGSETPHW